MDNRKLIIPDRFDHKDAVAGLKAIEQSGQVAGDLGHAADTASARFRKAHDSIKSASQSYLELRRTLQGVTDHEERPTADGLVANEAGQGGGTNLTPKEWRGSGDEIRSQAGARFGSSLTNAPSEQPGEDRSMSSPPPTTLGGPHEEAAAFTPGQAYLATSGIPAGPSHEGSAKHGGIPQHLGSEESRARRRIQPGGRPGSSRTGQDHGGGPSTTRSPPGIVREERDPGRWQREARYRTGIGPRRRGAARIRLARIIDPRGLSRSRRPGRQP